MTNTNKLGGYAALLNAALWLTFIVFIALINPQLGLTSPTDLNEASRLLPALQTAPALIIFPGLDMLVGVSILIIALAQDPRRASIIFGVGAGLLFIVLASNRLTVLPMLAAAYAERPAPTSNLFLLATAIYNGLSAAVRFCLGVWLLMVNIEQHREAPALAYLGIVLGVLNIASSFIEVLAAPNMILMPLWMFGLARRSFAGTRPA